MAWLLVVPLLMALFYLIGWGGCGYHQIENGHRVGNQAQRGAKW